MPEIFEWCTLGHDWFLGQTNLGINIAFRWCSGIKLGDIKKSFWFSSPWGFLFGPEPLVLAGSRCFFTAGWPLKICGISKSHDDMEIISRVSPNKWVGTIMACDCKTAWFCKNQWGFPYFRNLVSSIIAGEDLQQISQITYVRYGTWDNWWVRGQSAWWI